MNRSEKMSNPKEGLSFAIGGMGANGCALCNKVNRKCLRLVDHRGRATAISCGLQSLSTTMGSDPSALAVSHQDVSKCVPHGDFCLAERRRGTNIRAGQTFDCRSTRIPLGSTAALTADRARA